MHYSVIIVGAGMSGIKVAGDLFNAGKKDTLILESRDRAGGRLKSQASTLKPEVYYDFGASWFHDGLRNPLFEKAKKLGNVEYFFDDGKHLYISKDCKDISAWDFERIMADIQTFGNLYFVEDPKRTDISVRELCSLYLKANRTYLTWNQLKYAQQVVRMWLELWDGISWEEASAKHAFLWSVDHLGRNAYVKNGFKTVFQNELNELPDDYQNNNIKLNTQVTKIDYENPKMVKVTTADGSVFTADFIVVTAPLSILKIKDTCDEQYLQWTPPLPKEVDAVLSECEYGSLGKVVFEFKNCFWPRDVQRFYVLASELSSSGDATPWKNPTLVVNYAAMSDVASLVFLTQSPVSKQIEHMTNEQIWELFKPVVQQIATGSVSKPFNVLKTEWNKDPWIRGSYSAGRLNTRPTDEICELFAGGLTERVRFAGAETIGGSSNGCAHGAFYSGEREARFILQNSQMSSKI